MEKESERLQHLAVPFASLAIASTAQAKGTLNSRGTSPSTPRGSVVDVIRRSAFNNVDFAEMADLSEHGTGVDEAVHEIIHDFLEVSSPHDVEGS